MGLRVFFFFALFFFLRKKFHDPGHMVKKHRSEIFLDKHIWDKVTRPGVRTGTTWAARSGVGTMQEVCLAAAEGEGVSIPCSSLPGFSLLREAMCAPGGLPAVGMCAPSWHGARDAQQGRAEAKQTTKSRMPPPACPAPSCDPAVGRG